MKQRMSLLFAILAAAGFLAAAVLHDVYVCVGATLCWGASFACFSAVGSYKQPRK